jgi:HSP20 family protein
MLIRYDPFRDLTDQPRGAGRRGVPMDAIRRGDAVLVRFDLPGVDPGSIDVTVAKNVLTVTAQRPDDRQEGDEVVIAERPRGTFTRQLFLGDTLDTERIDADYNEGVLTLTIPVAEKAKPRKVEISVGGGDGDGARRIETKQQTEQAQVTA